MFCPPGYALLEDIFPRILDRSFVVADLSDLGPEDEFHRYRKHSLNAMFALEMFLSSCPSLSVCSPGGIVLRVSKRILARLHEDSSPPDHRFFECIEEHTWVIDIEPWGPAPIPPTDNDNRLGALLGPGPSVTPNNNAVVQALLSHQRERANFFSKFNGWSLTVRAEDLPEDNAIFDRYLFIGDIMDADEDDEISGSDQRGGRPLKIMKVLVAFCHCYPEGRKNFPVGVIQTSVIEKMGEDCSDSTLRRVFRLRDAIDSVRSKLEPMPEVLTPEQIAEALDKPDDVIGSVPLRNLVADAIRLGYPFK